MIEQFAKSKSGHDKGTVYAVYREEGDFVFLVDGRLKKVSNPKKKNVKHIQRIKNLPAPVKEILNSDIYHDEDNRIRNAIKEYMESGFLRL